MHVNFVYMYVYVPCECLASMKARASSDPVELEVVVWRYVGS